MIFILIIFSLFWRPLLDVLIRCLSSRSLTVALSTAIFKGPWTYP